MSSARSALNARWYREGWYSSRTCIDALENGRDRHTDTPVVFASDGCEFTTTVGEVGCRAREVAASLQGLGVGPGDAVAVQLTNRVECSIAYQAVLLCGAVLVPIVHIYGTAEVAFILAESGAAVLIMPDRFRSTSYLHRIEAYRRIPTLRDVVVVGAPPGSGYVSWSELTAAPGGYVRHSPKSDDVCLVIYTSGTTAAPKGVQHSHNSLLAEQKTLPGLLAGDSDSVQLVSFPPGHVAGVSSMLRPLVAGTRSVYIESWDPVVAAELIRRYGVTSTSGTPFHLQGLLERAANSNTLDTLREFLVGAATVTEEIGRRAAAAGINAYRCYGLTEHPTVTGARPDDPESIRLGTDGRPLPGSAVRILAPDGSEQPTGVDGEVAVQGPDQFLGYHNPTLDSEAFTPDGWLRTGDLGHLDRAGLLTITDRIKDVIIRAGETISSGQVEDILIRHPAVAEAVAIAAPDPRYGEVVAAIVVLNAGTTLELDELRRHFADSGLAAQKAPERLVITPSLPRNALGKVVKTELRTAHFGPRNG
jgi:acyl-CoA synthetase (AMP-forming)/AMP-acid ligase II